MLTDLFVIFVLLLVNAFFAASEMAFISLNDTKIKVMADQGDKKAKLIHTILSEPSKFLATIQIGITLAGFISSAFASESFSDGLVQLLKGMNLPISEGTLKTFSVFLISVILSYFSLVLGELVPKRFAMEKAEEMSNLAVQPLKIIDKILNPFVNLLTLSTNGIVRLFGIDPNTPQGDVTEEEIRMMVDVGEENGAIQETEKQMINNVFEFDNKDVSEIMTHRTEIVGIPYGAGFDEVMEYVKSELYTRFPVYKDSIDNIVGILHIKDLFEFIDGKSHESFKLEEIIRKPYFVPISKKIDELFVELKRQKNHMSIVIDEYDEEIKDIEKIDSTSYIINGTTDLDAVKEQLKMDLPTEEYETLSGFLIGELGRIPMKGERPEITFGGYIFKVQEIEDKRIISASVSRIAKLDDENENDEL